MEFKLTAQPSSHTRHFTSVMQRMTPFEHFRRWLTFAIGVHLVGGSNTKGSVIPTISADGVETNRKLTKGEATLGAFVMRGSDAYADAGNVATAIEIMKFNPVDWTMVYHTLNECEGYETLSDLQAQASIRAVELIETGIVDSPTDFTMYKLLGVLVAEKLDHNFAIRHQQSMLPLKPLTIDGAYIDEYVFDQETLVKNMNMVRGLAHEAFANRQNVRAH